MFRPPVNRPPPDIRDDEEKAEVARTNLYFSTWKKTERPCLLSRELSGRSMSTKKALVDLRGKTKQSES